MLNLDVADISHIGPDLHSAARSSQCLVLLARTTCLQRCPLEAPPLRGYFWKA